MGFGPITAQSLTSQHIHVTLHGLTEQFSKVKVKEAEFSYDFICIKISGSCWFPNVAAALVEAISRYSLPFTSPSYHTASGISPCCSPYVVKTFIKDGSEHSLQKWMVVEIDLNLLSRVAHMFPLTLFSSRHSNLRRRVWISGGVGLGGDGFGGI